MAGKYRAVSTRDELLSPRNRAYAYRVATALGGVAVFYGFLSGEELGVWLIASGVVLGTTSELAHANVPKVK